MSQYYDGELWLGAFHRGGLYLSPTDLVGHALSAFNAGARGLNCDESRGLTALVTAEKVFFTFDSADLPGNLLNKEAIKGEVTRLICEKFGKSAAYVTVLPGCLAAH
jgi:hypothetical protein